MTILIEKREREGEREKEREREIERDKGEGDPAPNLSHWVLSISVRHPRLTIRSPTAMDPAMEAEARERVSTHYTLANSLLSIDAII